MGMSKTAIWLALFAFVANAGSGLGLELVSPTNCAADTTVCDAQTMITALLTTSQPCENQGDVCGLQGALDQTCEDENDSVAVASIELAVQDRNPECAESPAATAHLDFGSLGECLLQSTQDATVYPDDPPDLRPAIERRSATQSPNAPPHLA
mgnify:CR=1 FL=1